MTPATRRDLLGAGGALVCVGLTGCLSEVREITDTMNDEHDATETPDSETTETPDSETTENEADSESVDGRLRNEDDTERVFDVTITDESGTSRDGTFEVGPGETTRIPAVGSPGDVLTVEATVADAEASETLELGGEAEPGELAGFVDIVYRPDGEIAISFEPTD